MIAYKLLTQDLQSHAGFQWKIGEKQVVTKPGNKMCSDQVLHCYSHPLMAVMFNVIHAKIQNPKLFKIETSKIINSDFAKLACKEQTLIKEVELPILTDKQKQEVAIRCALLLPYAPAIWTTWAENWLSGRDQTLESEAHAYAHAHDQARVHACAHAYARSRARAHAYACAHACANAYARAHAYDHACACAYAYDYACACAYACAYAHAHAHASQDKILHFLINATK